MNFPRNMGDARVVQKTQKSKTPHEDLVCGEVWLEDSKTVLIFSV